MNWEIRVDGRRYKLRNRKVFSIGIVMMVLLAAAMICLAIGILATTSGSALAPKATLAAVASGGTAAAAGPSAAVETAASAPTAPRAGVQKDDWRLTLVNDEHPLPDRFRVDTRELPNGLGIDARVYDDLMKMLDNGRRQGMALVVCSAYRSIAKQQELYDSKVQRIQQEEGKTYEQAYEEAHNTVAFPGTSEHNLGLAADIVAQSYQQLDEGYLNTEECKWLAENSWKYGFIMRYPEDKKDVTHIIFEPWHYRYVGVEAATAMKESGMCLEEYLGQAD